MASARETLQCPGRASSEEKPMRLCVFSANIWVCMLQHARGTGRPGRKRWCATESLDVFIRARWKCKLYHWHVGAQLRVKVKEVRQERVACVFVAITNYIQAVGHHKSRVPNLKSPRSPWWDRRGRSDTLVPTGAHEWRLAESHLRGTSLKPQLIWVSPRRSEIQKQQHWGFKSSVAETMCALPRLRRLPSSSDRATVTTGATPLPLPLLLFSSLLCSLALFESACSRVSW